MSRYVFKALKLVYKAVDRTLSPLFGVKFRQSYIAFAHRMREAFFPTQLSSVGSVPINQVWLPPAIPSWVLDEMKILGHELDPALYPSDQLLAKMQYYSFPVIPAPGDVYQTYLDGLRFSSYTHLFAIPWLKRGGADLVALKHVALMAAQPNTRVLVFMTEAGDSPWRDRLPDNVDVVDIQGEINKISYDEMLQVLARLIIQLEIGVLHIINSRYFWSVLEKYGLAITQKTKVFASVFCDDYDLNGLPVGYGREYLPVCYKYISKVFTDNQVYADLLHNTYGYKKDLFELLHTPAEVDKSLFKPRSNQMKPTILWAGRLDRQKRPDILLSIAKVMANCHFLVYGEAVLNNKDHTVTALKKLDNVSMMGAFNGVESLPFSDCDVFLYTSQWDGIPTMIIAAALAAIPVVASNVGGMSEVFAHNKDFLVDDIEDIDAYVERIKFILANYTEVQGCATELKEFILSDFNEAKFLARLQSVDHYIELQT